MAKNLPAMREAWVQSLGQENPLEKGKPIHSSILAWRIPWTDDPGGLQPVESKSVRYDRATNTQATCVIDMCIEHLAGYRQTNMLIYLIL